MHVQKSFAHQGHTLAHGTFRVRETVYTCAGRCQHPGGALVTRRAARLQQLLLPRRTVGYCVMVKVGLARFVHHRQREEIRDALQAEYGIALSTGTISDLARLFCEYLRALHEERAGDLRTALERDGGYPLLVDATGENGRGTLLIAFAGWRGWVLGAWKIPTERADAVLPRLRETVGLFGPPCAIMRDLGKAMISAAADLVAGLEQSIPILSCHSHFLSDVGEDLLDSGHAELRQLFRRHKIRKRLRDLARAISRKLGAHVARAREAVEAWQVQPGATHALPEGKLAGHGAVRSLAQWALDYVADASGADFPFDRPYLDLHDRCRRVRRAIDAQLRTPPEDKAVLGELTRLARILDPVRNEPAFSQAATALRRRAALFDELRAALRLRTRGRDVQGREPDTSEQELHDIKLAVEELTLSLRERRPRRGPAQDTRQAIDLILAHLDRHGASLWGHVIPLSTAPDGNVRLVDRTNNQLEGRNRLMKQGERRRSGRKTLADDFEHLPPEAALALNLRQDDYVETLCGSLDQLPSAFAALDAARRTRELAADTHSASAPHPAVRDIVSASLPKEDRDIVRSSAMNARIAAAARSRAPRADTAPARC